MNFSQVDINEEVYDPEGQVVRSRQNITESADNQRSVLSFKDQFHRLTRSKNSAVQTRRKEAVVE